MDHDPQALTALRRQLAAAAGQLRLAVRAMDDGLVPARSLLADVNDVAAWLGGGGRVATGDGTVFVLGGAATAVVMDAADDPAVSGVRSASTFTVVGPVPDIVATRLSMHFHPHHEEFVPTHVFVRVTSGLLYLGLAGEPRLGRGYTTDRDEWTLHLFPVLNRTTLDTVRPVSRSEVLPGLDWLAHAADDPVEAARRFITGWYPKVAPEQSACGQAVSDLASVPLPRALRELYRAVAGRPRTVLGTWQCISHPRDLSVDSATGRLKFAWGNEGNWTWACDTGDDDPAVWLTREQVHPVSRPEPDRDPERLGGFLLRFTLAQAVVGLPYQGLSRGARVRASVADRLTAGLRRVPVGPSRWDHHAELYVAPGLVVGIDHVNERERRVAAGATHGSALRRLATADIDWHEFDG
ncbi:hypothetical protein OG216_00530 [Streptomycetaceae bacterium NBC_01309]